MAAKEADDLCEALPLPSADLIARIENARGPKPRREVKGDFVKLLAAHRSRFAGKVFLKEEAGQELAHKLLFATQNPLRAFFLPLVFTDREFPVLPADMGVVERQGHLRHIDLYEFKWIPGTYITDKGLGAMDDFDKVWVFEDVVFKGEQGLGGSCFSATLQAWAERHDEHLTDYTMNYL